MDFCELFFQIQFYLDIENCSMIYFIHHLIHVISCRYQTKLLQSAPRVTLGPLDAQVGRLKRQTTATIVLGCDGTIGVVVVEKLIHTTAVFIK